MIPNQNKRCKHCDALLDVEAQFCEDCGQPVEEPAVSQPQPPPQSVSQPLASPQYASSQTLPQSNLPPAPAPKKRGNTCLIVGLGLLVGCLCLIAAAVGGYFLYTKFNTPAQAATPPDIRQLPTPTHAATSTDSPPSDAITVEGCEPAENCPEATSYRNLSTLEPNIEHKVTIPADKKVRFHTGWCATTRDLLDENLNSLNFVFTIDGDSYMGDFENGYSISEDPTDPSKQVSCYDMGGVVTGWQEGRTYRVMIGFTINESIFDGYSYTKSDQLRIYLISIDSNASVQPAAPTSENSTIPDCPGAPPSRLHIGDDAEVVNVGGYSLVFRKEPRSDAAESGSTPEGRPVIIREGPVCSENAYWWNMEFGEGGKAGWAWAPETSSDGSYLLDPIP